MSGPRSASSERKRLAPSQNAPRHSSSAASWAQNLERPASSRSRLESARLKAPSPSPPRPPRLDWATLRARTFGTLSDGVGSAYFGPAWVSMSLLAEAALVIALEYEYGGEKTEPAFRSAGTAPEVPE